MVRYAYEKGINYFDTARAYGDSEDKIGVALKEVVKGLLNKWLILRYGTTLGPEMRPALATYIFLKQAMNNEEYTIRGDGNQTRNWIYIDDVVKGSIKAMEYHLETGNNEVFNLTGEKAYSVNQLTKICNEVV